MSEKPFGLAVKAFVFDDKDRCLLLRRSMQSKFFGGKWDLPGGKVDPGESFDAAMLRETREETGLTILLTGVAGATEYDMPQVRVVMLFLEARVIAGEVRPSDEHDEFVWTPRSELPGMELSKQLKAFVETYVRQERSHGED